MELTRTYRVGSLNYLLQSGGDGMVMFKNCNVVKDAVISDVDLLSHYINTFLGGSMGTQYGAPYGEGRIVIK